MAMVDGPIHPPWPFAISHQPCQNDPMRIPILIALLAQILSPNPKPGHATIVASPAEVNGTAGGKLALFVDVTPKPNIHVYAPGSEFYIPITVKLNPSPEIKAGKLAYPKSETITLLDEKVAVFQ